MTQIASEDYPNKLIYLHVDTVTSGFDPAVMQQEHRARRRLNANSERNYYPMVAFSGYVEKGSGKYTPKLTVLSQGVRVVPYDPGGSSDYNLDILNEVLDPYDVVSDRDVIDRQGITIHVNVDSTYNPVEIVEVEVGGGGTIAADSYGGVVHVDPNSPHTGTTAPTGTLKEPVNNMADAKSIADAEGITTFYLHDDISLATVDYTGYAFIARDPTEATLTVNASATVTECYFQGLKVTGTLSSSCVIQGCILDTITGFQGYIDACIFTATTQTLGAGLTHIANSRNEAPGAGVPVIDFDGAVLSSLAMRAYTGDITLTNKLNTESATVDLTAGQVTVDNSVMAGVISLRGVGTWANRDSYAGSASVVDQLVERSILDATLTQATTSATNAIQAVAEAQAAASAAYNAEIAALAASNVATEARDAAQNADTAAQAAEAAALAAQLAAEAAETNTDQLILDAGTNNPILEKLLKAHYNKRMWDKVAETLTVYEDDESTPLAVFDTNADLSEITPQ